MMPDKRGVSIILNVFGLIVVALFVLFIASKSDNPLAVSGSGTLKSFENLIEKVNFLDIKNPEIVHSEYVGSKALVGFSKGEEKFGNVVRPLSGVVPGGCKAARSSSCLCICNDKSCSSVEVCKDLDFNRIVYSSASEGHLFIDKSVASGTVIALSIRLDGKELQFSKVKQ